MVSVGARQIKDERLLSLLNCAVLVVKKQKTPMDMRGMKNIQG